MSIKFRCPECQHPIKAPDTAAGKGVRCPNCQNKTRVPSPKQGAGSKSRSSRKKSLEPSSEDSNAFLANIDLGKAEADVELCQKCAAELAPGESICPECGFDPEQLTVAGRKRQKMAAKGIDPKGYYENVLRGPLAFTKSHIGQALKTGSILTVFFLLSAVCGYFLIWVATGPPFAFWTLVTTVCLMIPIGWLLVQHLEIIQLTIQKKDKIRKIRFDFAMCGMTGMKFLAWVFIYGLPLWILFGGFGVLLDFMGISQGIPIGLSLALFAIFVTAPQGLSHLAMPVEYPGWIFPKVAKTFPLSFLPGLVWAILVLVVNIPVIGGFAAVYYVGGEKFQEFVDVRLLDAKVHRAKVELKLADSSGMEARIATAKERYTEDANLEVPAKNWGSIALPISIGVLSCYLVGFTSLIAARANGLFTSHLRKGLDLITSTKELVYQRKEQGEEKVRTRKTTLEALPAMRGLGFVIDLFMLLALNGTVLGMAYYIATSMFDPDFESMTVKIISICVATIPPLFVMAMYFVTNETGLEQGSPGKQAMNMFVAADDRCQPISTGQAVGRFFAFIFLSCILTGFIGNLMALFRPDRRALHDLITGTQVRMDKPKLKKKKTEADEEAVS